MADYIVQIPAQLAPLLRALRRHRHLTQKQMAERLGVTRQAISDLERHPETATFERLMRACKILGVNIVLRASSDPQPDPP